MKNLLQALGRYRAWIEGMEKQRPNRNYFDCNLISEFKNQHLRIKESPTDLELADGVRTRGKNGYSAVCFKCKHPYDDSDERFSVFELWVKIVALLTLRQDERLFVAEILDQETAEDINSEIEPAYIVGYCRPAILPRDGYAEVIGELNQLSD